MRDNAYDARLGNRPTAMRPPSSGGSGNRFNAINIRLIEIPICAICDKPSLAQIPDGSVARINNAHKNAMAKLANGPAPATQIMSRLGWRRFPKFTGTGLAQP